MKKNQGATNLASKFIDKCNNSHKDDEYIGFHYSSQSLSHASPLSLLASKLSLLLQGRKKWL